MMKRSYGFTLIELLVTLTILSIVAVYAVPTFSEAIRNNQLKSSANSLYSLFQYARAEAAQKGETIYVGALDNANWSNGAVAWLDNNDNASFDLAVDEEIRRSVNNYNLVVAEETNVLTVAIDGKGYVASAIELGICKPNGTSQGKQLKVLTSGVAAVSDKVDCL